MPKSASHAAPTRTFITLLLLALGNGALANDCEAKHQAGLREGAAIPGCEAIHKVIGQGRLQFYSAPDSSCKLPGVFIIPGDTAVAQSEHEDYTAVLYINPKTGKEVSGWVLSKRLEPTGAGIAPCQ